MTENLFYGFYYVFGEYFLPVMAYFLVMGIFAAFVYILLKK